MAELTDRELLERAARAYWGEEIDDVMSYWWGESEQSIVFIYANGNEVELLWRPLTDDGDALRLAVKLRMSVRYEGAEVWVRAKDKPAHFDWCGESINPDIDAATRRAIVRAAASLATEGGV